MLQQFNSNNNNDEILFFKVIHNHYLFRKIIGFVGYKQYDLDFITTTKKMQFSNIISMSWMIKHNLTLLLDKLNNNQFVKIASKDLKYFFKYYDGENEKFDQLFNLLVKIQDSDTGSSDTGSNDDDDDGSKKGEYQLYNSYRYLRDSKSNCYSYALKYACLKPFIHYYNNSIGNGQLDNNTGNENKQIPQFDYENKESSIKSMVYYFSDNGIKKEHCGLVPFQLLMDFNSIDLKYKVLELGLLVGMNGSDYRMILFSSLSFYKKSVELVLFYLHLVHYYTKTVIQQEILDEINGESNDLLKMKLIKFQLIKVTNNQELYFDYLKCYNEIINIPNTKLMEVHYKSIYQWTFSAFNSDGLNYLNSIEYKPTTSYNFEDLIKHYKYYEKESYTNVVEFLKLYYSTTIPPHGNDVFINSEKMGLRMSLLFDKINDLSILDEILNVDGFDFKLFKFGNEFQYLKITPFSKLVWYIENIEKKLPLDQCTIFQDYEFQFQFQFQVPNEIKDLEYIIENNDQYFKIHEIDQLEINDISTIQYLNSSNIYISDSSLLSKFLLNSISNCNVNELKFIYSNPKWLNVDIKITNKQFQESKVFDGCTTDEIKELLVYLVENRFKMVPWDLVLWFLNKLYFEMDFCSDQLSSIIDFNIIPTVSFSCLVNSIFENEIIISNQIIEKFKFEWFQIDHLYINSITPTGIEILSGYKNSGDPFYRNSFKFKEIHSVMKWFATNFEKSIKVVPFFQRVFNQLYSIMVCCSDITFENIDQVHQLYNSFSIGIVENSFLHFFYYLDLKSPFLSNYLKYKRSTKVLLDGIQTFDYVCQLQGTTDSSSVQFLNLVVGVQSTCNPFRYELIKLQSIETTFYSMCKLLGITPTFQYQYSTYLKEDVKYCFENNKFSLIMGMLKQFIPTPIDHIVFIESFGYIFKYLSINQVDHIIKQTIQQFGSEIIIIIIETAIKKQRLDLIKFIFENYKSHIGSITNYIWIYKLNLLDIAHYFFKYQNQSLKLFDSDGKPVRPEIYTKAGQSAPHSMEEYAMYKGYNQLSQLHLKYYKK